VKSAIFFNSKAIFLCTIIVLIGIVWVKAVFKNKRKSLIPKPLDQGRAASSNWTDAAVINCLSFRLSPLPPYQSLIRWRHRAE
jgi:hypothetical protein